MTQRSWFPTLACLLALVIAAGVQADTLTILHLNDTHAHLLPYGPDGGWGGYARLATAVGMARMTEPNVMLLHGGDLSVGDFMFQKYLGIPELEILKQLGCDALELGNHEFDLYPSALKYMLSEAGFPDERFPVLCANMDFSADPEMGYFVRPYTIKEYGGTKVGIFGLITDFVNIGSNPTPHYAIAPLDVAQQWIDTLRIGHGCDVVILLSHLGYMTDQMVAMSTAGIDVIVGGHSHTELGEPSVIGSTLILQGGEFGKNLGRLRLEVESGAVVGWNYQLIPINSDVPAEPTLEAFLGGLVAGVEADPRFGPVYTAPVAEAAIDLGKPLSFGLVMDNAMGNLVADACREATGTDIAFQPQGFTSQGIWAGLLTGNDIFQAVPYGFDPESGLGLKLVTFETDGMSLGAGLEFTLYNMPYLEDLFLHTSGLTYAYYSGNAPGGRVDFGSMRVGGAPFDPYATYTITTPEAVLPFLSQIPGFVINNLAYEGGFVYTAVRDFIIAQSPVAYYPEGRIIDLTVLGDPAEGAMALAALPGMYLTAGMIADEETANHLTTAFEVVARHAEAGRTTPAVAKLTATARQVGTFAREGMVSEQAAGRLVYLIGNLIESIENPVTPKEGEGSLAQMPQVPETMELLPNYPNPFNPTTEISFAMPEAARVKLEIFNVLGQRVAVLVDGELPGGRHSVTWDASGQASGLYLYRLTAGDFAATKKMTLVK